jgi:hypothetical protein
MDWEALLLVARNILKIWRHEGDLDWAAQAWKILGDAGLTDYEDELERSRVIIRFLSLVDFYQGFCGQFCEEFVEPEFWDWATQLEVDMFSLGRLVGLRTGIADEQQAIEHLVSEEKEVLPAVEKGFGGRMGLFVALVRSTFAPERNDIHDEDYWNDREILFSYGAAALDFGLEG